MNYSVLFPKILNNLPKLDEDNYRYQFQNNKKREFVNIYVPRGRKQLLWYTKYDDKTYCFTIDLHKNGGFRTNQMKFRYASFSEELAQGKGTIILGIKIHNEFCCDKILYYCGVKYNEKMVMEHMDKLKHIIENEVRNVPSEDFLNVRLPFMNTSRNYIHHATNLSYKVYEIRHADNRSHKLHNYTGVFNIQEVDSKSDIYQIICKKNGIDHIMDNVCVNDFKTSSFLRNQFKPKYKNYREIEYSDSEDEDNDEEKEKSVPHDKHKTLTVRCAYIVNLKKWKPIDFVHSSPIITWEEVKKIER